MGAYALPQVDELRRQLELSPSRLRLKQVRGIERALSLIDAETDYPYELVCYWVTGFRSVGSGGQATLPGDQLIPDLVQMSEDLTRKAPIPVAVLAETYLDQAELARRFNVTTKTITRWRKRGLCGFRAVLENEQVKLVFGESAIRRFATRHEELIRKAAAFTQLTDNERAGIVERARELASEERLRLYDLSQRVASETGRAVETIRYTLRRHDEQNPQQAVFERDGRPRIHPDYRKVYAAYQDRQSVEQIANRMGRASTTVRRIVNEMRARELHERPVKYIHNDDFDAPRAEDRILGEPCALDEDFGVKPAKAGPAKAGPYLQRLYETPLLTVSEERDLFRRYNYLKYKAHQLRSQLDPVRVDIRLLRQIEDLLNLADKIRNRLIKCNLRLVVSIAKRHVGAGDRFFEAVSNGNVALMRAVEKFDYARGNRFSTYASWAVMREYARTIPEEEYRAHRYMSGQEDVLNSTVDPSAVTGPLGRLQAVKEALAIGWKVLTRREQKVLQRRFGLRDSGKSETLEQVGKAFGVSKERVRQIENGAMTKLREVLTPMKADLLG